MTADDDGMTGTLFDYVGRPKSPPPNWKPEKCFDCGAPHPCFSKTGRGGPWRCPTCHWAITEKP